MTQTNQALPSTLVRTRGKIRINNPDYTRPLKIFLLGFLALSLILMYVVPFDWKKIISRIPNLASSFKFLLVLDLSEADIVLPYFYETLSVAVLSTVYSAGLGLFLAIFQAKNITPHRFLPPIFTALFTFIRAVPSFIWVLLVLVCLGFGSAPAIVGICIHSTAFFAQAFSRSFEEIRPETLEALASTGANKTKTFFSAVLPSALTSLIAWLSMSFETNFHGAAILGMVGAGGVGHIIQVAFNSYRYGRAWLAVLIVVGFTYLFEFSSVALKQRLKV